MGRTRMLLPNTGRKVADWLSRGFMQYDYFRFLRAATIESQKTLNKCETRNKTVFHTRLRHPETINSVPLNNVLRIKQIGV